MIRRFWIAFYAFALAVLSLVTVAVDWLIVSAFFVLQRSWREWHEWIWLPVMIFLPIWLPWITWQLLRREIARGKVRNEDMAKSLPYDEPRQPDESRNSSGAKAMTRRVGFAFVLVVMIAASIGMAVTAVERNPGWFSHPGATPYFEEAVFSLMVYAGVIVTVVAKRGEEWDEELKNAAIFGSIAAVVDLVNSAVDHIASATVFAQAVNFTALLVMFALWGWAAARTSRNRGRFRPGLLTSLMAAGITIVIAEVFGFAFELFIAPTSDATTRAAFSRSGWTDSSAFAIADTFRVGFTNLWLGPMVGLIVGCLGAALGWRMSRARKTVAAPPTRQTSG